MHSLKCFLRLLLVTYNVLMGTLNPTHSLTHSLTLVWSTSTRDLRIDFDNNHKFDQHISDSMHSANVRAILVLRSFISRDLSILTEAFTICVHPMVEYCIPIWSPHSIGVFKRLTVHRRNSPRNYTAVQRLTVSMTTTVFV